MGQIMRMMSEVKQVCLRKYLWLAGIVCVSNILYTVLMILFSTGNAYRFPEYHLPETAPMTLRIAMLVLLVFQLRDALQFMNKGSLQRVLILPAKRYLYPIAQILFTFLCIMLLWGAFCSSILLSYYIFSMRFGFVEDGLIYTLLSEPIIHVVLPLEWDRIINVLVAMFTLSVMMNVVCSFLQAPIYILKQLLLITVVGLLVFAVSTYFNDSQLLSSYIVGAICMGIIDALSIAFTLYSFQIGKASG